MGLVVLLVGLPGVGKSTLAGPLADALAAGVVDRDRLKAAAVPQPYLTHSAVQVRLASRLCLMTGEATLAEHPDARLIIDGHSFARSADRDRWTELARRHGIRCLSVWCRADADVVRTRIESDANGLAKDRGWEKYLAVRDRFEPPQGDTLSVDLTEGPGPAVRSIVTTIRGGDGSLA